MPPILGDLANDYPLKWLLDGDDDSKMVKVTTITSPSLPNAEAFKTLFSVYCQGNAL